MTPSARNWRIDRIAEWRAKAEALRALSVDRYTADPTIWGMSEEIRADTLDRICDQLQAEIETAPIMLPPPPPAPPRPHILSLCKRDQHLESARVCRKLGAPDAAANYERLAAACDGDGEPTGSASTRPIAPAIINITLAEVVPFTMGPQIEFFI